MEELGLYYEGWFRLVAGPEARRWWRRRGLWAEYVVGLAPTICDCKDDRCQALFHQ